MAWTSIAPVGCGAVLSLHIKPPSNVVPLPFAMSTASSLPPVSVLIRSMGRPVLANALASIAAQTYAALEVVVVAACGDSHPALPASCGAFPLRLVGNGNKLARAHAANFGIACAHHDYCVFLDDDDTHAPRHIAGLMQTLLASPESRLAYSAIRVVDAHGRERTVISSEYDRLALHQQNYIQLGAAVFSRSLYTKDGCRFDPDVGSYDDWDFWLQCSEHTQFVFRKEATTNWYADAGESGAGMGKNFDPVINRASRAAVENKWKIVREDLQQRFFAVVAGAHKALADKTYGQAEACFRAALQIHSGHPATLNSLAMLLYARRNYDEAREHLLRATQTPGDQSGNLCNLAMVEIAVNKPDLARRLLQHALRDHPGHPRALALLGKLSNSTQS
jgi:tetratricopeptide (TPR) repeat protein